MQHSRNQGPRLEGAEPQVGDVFVLDGGFNWKITEVEDGGGCILTKLDRNGNLLNGNLDSRYIPGWRIRKMKEEYFLSEPERLAQGARKSARRAVETSPAQPASHIVIWEPGEGHSCLDGVYMQERSDGIFSLQDAQGEDWGTIDREHLDYYMKRGRELEGELRAYLARNHKAAFMMRSSSDPNKIYTNCQFVGINVVTGGIVAVGYDERGSRNRKEFLSEQEFWQAIC